MKNLIKATVVLSTILVIGSSNLRAEMITIKIESKVLDVHYPGIAGLINVGDIVTGSYTYDSTIDDIYPDDPGVGVYKYNSPPNGIELTVNGYVFKTDADNVNFEIAILDNLGLKDYYIIHSYNNLPVSMGSYDYNITEISWQLEDDSRTAFSSDVLPTTAPVLENFYVGKINIEFGSGNMLFRSEVTKVELIPEPCTILLLGLGAVLVRKSTKTVARR